MPLLSLPRCLVLAALATTLAGCSTTTGHAQAQGAGATQAATTSDSLAETSWELVRWTGKDGATRALPQGGQPISISFLAQGRDYRVAGFSGCNRYNGTYSLQGGRLTITSPASTRMACASAQLSQLETAYLKALGQISTFTLDSGGAPRQMTLNLRDGDIMAFSRLEDAPTKP